VNSRRKDWVIPTKAGQMSRIVGVVYPVPINLVGRLFTSRRNVFVKYLPRTTSINLRPGDKVLFYASHASKQVIGEGIIKDIEFLTPDEALSKHGDKLLLNKEELANYTARQPMRTSAKKMLALTIDKATEYATPIRYPRPLTMAGEYITKEKYESLMKKV